MTITAEYRNFIKTVLVNLCYSSYWFVTVLWAITITVK